MDIKKIVCKKICLCEQPGPSCNPDHCRALEAAKEIVQNLANEADCRLDHGGDIAGFAAYLWNLIADKKQEEGMGNVVLIENRDSVLICDGKNHLAEFKLTGNRYTVKSCDCEKDK